MLRAGPPGSSVGSTAFRGTDRFRLLRILGKGGMGVVYEALDRSSNMRVALKLLPTLNAEMLLHFKNEFRALADITHPNLVRLGELFSEGEQWFFTMELIEGPSFLDYVRGVPADRQMTPTQPAMIPLSPGAGADLATARSVTPNPWRPERGPLDHHRLRVGLVQLTRGLQALHAAGKVHRDIKPPNLLVASDERLVILDFGLASEIVDEQTLLGLGTPAYMAPEQAAMRPVGAAADYYSVGVLLYEALTGRRPFEGLSHEVLYAKQREVPAPPRQHTPDVPADLEELTLALLEIDPNRRATGADILRRLRDTTVIPNREAPDHDAPVSLQRARGFMGREREMASLRAAFDETAGGNPVVALLTGESGVGKSALARRFLDDVARSRQTTVLAGRCYERESVPFKALDGVFDALAVAFSRLPTSEVEKLLPPEASLLVQVFPVLGRVEALALQPHASPAVRDPQELRARVFAAARALFLRLCGRWPLALLIDDLHWADNESMALLEEILRSPGAPNLLLVATLREAPGARSAPWIPAEVFAQAGAVVRPMQLSNLGPEPARNLVQALLAGTVSEAEASAIAEEAGGHPLFIQELVRATRAAGADPPAGERRTLLRLDDALWARCERLDPGARRILELVVTAAGPTAQDAILDAAGLEPSEFAQQVSLLRGAHLVRTRGPRHADAIETYHDRVRNAVWQHLSPEIRRERQGQLARALEGRAEDATLALYWREAGNLEKAARHASRAAEQALRALAFERAAEHLHLALELGTWDAGEARGLRVQLADALANAGQGHAAAKEYLRAAEGASELQGLALQRRGAEELLRSGHIDEGLKAARIALAAAGMSLVRSPRAALVALLLERVKLRTRGLDFKERDESQIPASQLARIDLCWSLSSGLGLVVHLQGAAFQTRSLRLALAAGEPYRIARALAGEAGFVATRGTPARARVEHLLHRCQSIAERLGHPHALGMAALMNGIAGHMRGEFRPGREALEKAERLFRDRCTGVAWELDATRQFWFECSYYLGDLPAFARCVASGIREARERGALYAVTNLRTGLANMTSLLADDPDRAEHDSEEALRGWSRQGFHIQHWYGLIARTQIDLYRGDGLAAWRRVDEAWSELRGSLLLEVQHSRVAALHLRGRTALAAAAQQRPTERGPWLARATRDARSLRKEKARWADALAALLEAGAVALAPASPADGPDRSATLGLLTSAIAALEAADLALFAAAARHERLALRQDEAGRAARDAASAWMAEAGIKNPARLAAMLAPGVGTT